LGIISIILLGVLSLTPSYFSFEKQPIVTVEKLISLSSNQKNQPQTEGLCVGPVQGSCLESPDYYLVQKSSLMSLSPPITVTSQVLGSVIGGLEEPEVNKEIIEYVVESGDNLLSIADKFNISLETLLWANDLNKNSTIRPGQKLIILPVSGVIHYVKSGDTLSEIAQKYKANIGEIISFNELSGEGDIYIGDILIIPNGVMPPPPPKTKKPSVTEYPEVPLAKSYFICPISSPYKITKGLHWYNAIDLSNGKCGSPIYAAAQGEVLKTKFGWNRGYGNYLSILHPNGVVTTYAHLQAILVSPGTQVSQGQIIGLMGGSPGTPGAGHSTGCHLHFEVHGAKNPFAR